MSNNTLHINVKQPLDITLKTLHVGEHWRVVTLAINGKDPAEDFLEKLHHDNKKLWKQIAIRIASVSNYPSYQNKQTYKYLSEGIFEFKSGSLRLYTFHDKLPNDGDPISLILCSNGGNKNTPKEQSKNIAKALEIKKTYFDAKKQSNVSFTLEQ